MDGLVFKIGGEEFPFDSTDSLTMDEAIILHDYSGLTLDKLEDVEGFNPKVIAAFMHIAVARKMPDLKQSDIRKKVGAVKITDLEDAFTESEEADARPPEPQPTRSDEPGRPAGSEQRSGGNGLTDGDPSLELKDRISTGSPG